MIFCFKHNCRRASFAICLLLISACQQQTDSLANKASTSQRLPQSEEFRNLTTDPMASNATQALFFNLYRTRGQHLIFGHQNANIEGMGWKLNGTSDVLAVAGRLPGVIGMDLREVIKWPHIFKLPYYHKVREAHHAGAIVTFSWHMDNPVTRGNFFDKTPAIHAILPGGELHQYYIDQLNQVADFFFSLRDNQGEYIPIIFRPYHEHNGNWFWWSHSNRRCEYLCFMAYGRNRALEAANQDFIKLWQFTVDYLRKRRGVHHLLIAYSPGITVERDYFWRWPGNQYVDVMGLDKYVPSVSILRNALSLIVAESKKRQKIAALTETGLERVTDANYWTRNFLNPIKNDPLLKELSYAMVWRNSSDSNDHYFAPYHGHASVPDFLAMARDTYILMAGDQIKSYFKVP